MTISQRELLAQSAVESGLDDLANRFGSDKGTAYGSAHGYAVVYELLLRAYRSRPINLLELGLCIERSRPRSGEGHVRTLPSVEMWKAYFPLATVYGFDITDFTRFEDGRMRFTRGDIGCAEDLRRLSALGVTFDVIIDDASHASYHQLLAFSLLFGSVKPGGLYIIEDLHWQPRAPERTLPRTETMARVLEQIGSGASPPAGLPVDISAAVRDIYSITTYDDTSLERLKRFQRIRRGLRPEPTPPERPLRRFVNRLVARESQTKLAVVQKV